MRGRDANAFSSAPIYGTSARFLVRSSESCSIAQCSLNEHREYIFLLSVSIRLPARSILYIRTHGFNFKLRDSVKLPSAVCDTNAEHYF